MFNFQEFYFYHKKNLNLYFEFTQISTACLLSSSMFIKSCFLLGNIRMYIEDINVDELVQAVNVCWCGRIFMRNVRLQRSDSLTRKAQGLSQRWTSETSWLLSRVICSPRRSMTILLRSVGITFFFAFFAILLCPQAYPSHHLHHSVIYVTSSSILFVLFPCPIVLFLTHSLYGCFINRLTDP